jgi:hypothetical protein
MSAPSDNGGRSSVATLAELMSQMGSKDGFDPMPPSQHRYLLDVHESETDRAIAWMWSKTIHPGKGHRRSPFARDERGALTLKHAAADLGWEMSNASAAFSRLSDQGRIRKDAKGHFYLEGDVPEPQRTQGEDEQKRGKKNSAQLICTDKLPKAFAVYLQQLPKNESLQREQDYFRIQEYRKKLEADAMAAARTKGQELVDEYFEAIGFQHKTLRGRPKVEREEEVVQLSLLALPELSVQISRISGVANSVQEGGPIPYKSQNGSVQITPSLLRSENRDIREEHSPPTPSHADAQEGRSEPQKPSEEPPKPKSYWSTFLFAAREAHMLYAEGQYAALERRFKELSTTEQQSAIQGIQLRLETGEYADAHFVPGMKRYLTEKLWTAKLRPGAKTRKDSATEEFNRRMKEELAEAQGA